MIIIKIIEFQSRIMKINKQMKYTRESWTWRKSNNSNEIYENHENCRIPFENNKIYEILRIS